MNDPTRKPTVELIVSLHDDQRIRITRTLVYECTVGEFRNTVNERSFIKGYGWRVRCTHEEIENID